MSTSTKRWPAYTDPGTGPYDTAHGASSAPGASNAAAAACAERSYASVASGPTTSPSYSVPTASMVSPAARRDAHQLPATTWFSSARTSQSSHGVGRVHWSGEVPAT